MPRASTAEPFWDRDPELWNTFLAAYPKPDSATTIDTLEHRGQRIRLRVLIRDIHQLEDRLSEVQLDQLDAIDFDWDAPTPWVDNASGHAGFHAGFHAAPLTLHGTTDPRLDSTDRRVEARGLRSPDHRTGPRDAPSVPIAPSDDVDRAPMRVTPRRTLQQTGSWR